MKPSNGHLPPDASRVQEAMMGAEPIAVTTVRDPCGAAYLGDDAKRTEAEYRLLVDRLLQSNKELERFAYAASHDMQEPVRILTSFSNIIMKEYGERLDEAGQEYLRLVTAAAERIHLIIEDLLDYARIDGAERKWDIVDVSRELQNVLANLAPLINEHNAQITCGSLPVFEGNAVQIMRLLQNLIVNAVKYRHPGRNPEIHIRAQEHGHEWRLSVTDNGIGIDETYSKQIFEPFRRLHSWEQVKGTGMGLAMCKKIAENHGGRIWVTSVPKRGSTFFIAIPKQCARQRAA